MTSLNPVYTIGNQIMEAVLLHTDKTKAQARDRAGIFMEGWRKKTGILIIDYSRCQNQLPAGIYLP